MPKHTEAWFWLLTTLQGKLEIYADSINHSVVETTMPLPSPRDTALAKATIRAAEALGLDMASLLMVLGFFSEGEFWAGIPPESEYGQRALQFLRIYRALSSLTSHDQTWMRAWMMAENNGLKGIPAELLRSAAGLGRVTSYLERLESLANDNGS